MMSDEDGIKVSRTDLILSIVAGFIILVSGCVFFSGFKFTPQLAPDQVRCMIANPGRECEEIRRWEPVAEAPLATAS